MFSLTAAFQIRLIPTLMVFREKVILLSQPGALPTSGLEEVIARTKELDMQQVHAELAAQKTQASG